VNIIDRKMTGVITEILGKEFLNDIARNTKFIQKESIFGAESFIYIFFIDNIYL
jgi:hypothetical protein